MASELERSWFILVLLLLFISIAMFPATYLLRKGKGFLWYFGILFGWYLSSIAFLLFYSKTAGFSYYVNLYLFVFDSIRTFLLYTRINLLQITVMQVIGRSIFAVCLLGYACSVSKIIQYKKRLIIQAVNIFFGILNFILYFPKVYLDYLSKLPLNYLGRIAFMVRAWYVVVIVFSFILLFIRYKNTTFKWFKNKQLYINTGIMAFTGFYIYVILRGPIQYYQPKSYFHIYGDFSYYTPPITPYEWMIWLVLLLALIAVSIYSFWQYSKYEKQFQTDKIRLNNKMFFIGGGISILSHAIKNHLISSGFMLEDALSKIKSTENSKQAEKLISQAINQNNAILKRLDQLRDTLKHRDMNLSRVKCESLFKQVFDRIHVPGNIELISNIQNPKLTLLIDIECMVQSFQNIITNSIEAIGTKPGKITVSQYIEEEWCVIQVKDNGPGMDELSIKQIFEPFYSNKNSSHNWGIGLSFVKKIVAAHGGIIDVKSSLHKGTSFYILLPHV